MRRATAAESFCSRSLVRNRFSSDGIAGIFSRVMTCVRFWSNLFVEEFLSDWYLGLCRLRTSDFGASPGSVAERFLLRVNCTCVASYWRSGRLHFSGGATLARSRRSDSPAIYLDKRHRAAQSEFSSQLWYTLTGGNFPPFLRVLRDVRNSWRFKKWA